MKIVISDQIAAAIELLPSAEMRAVFFSVYFAYVTTGAMPEESVAPEIRAMFLLAKPQIDRLNRAAIKKREAANAPEPPKPESQEKPALYVEPSEDPVIPDEMLRFKKYCDGIQQRLGRYPILTTVNQQLAIHRLCVNNWKPLLYHAMIDIYSKPFDCEMSEFAEKVNSYLPKMIRHDVATKSPWLKIYAKPA